MNLVDVIRLSNGPISDLISWLQAQLIPLDVYLLIEEWYWPREMQTTLMDIYGKVYGIRVIRAQVIFITSICFRDQFGQLLDNSVCKKKRMKKLADKEPNKVPDS